MIILKFGTKEEAQAKIVDLQAESDRVYKEHTKFSPVQFYVRRRGRKYQIWWVQAEHGLSTFKVHEGWVKE